MNSDKFHHRSTGTSNNTQYACVVDCVSDRNLNKSSASCVPKWLLPSLSPYVCHSSLCMNANDAKKLSMDYKFCSREYAEAATANTYGWEFCIYMWSTSVLDVCIWFFPGICRLSDTHTHWNLSNWKSYKLKAILSLLFAFMHGICAMRLYLALYRALCECVCGRSVHSGESDFAAFPLCQHLPTFWFLSDMEKNMRVFSFVCPARSVHMSLFALPDSVGIVDENFRWRCLNESNASSRGMCDAQHNTESIR